MTDLDGQTDDAMTHTEDEAPVLLLRTCPDEIIAVGNVPAGPGWLRLAGRAFATVAPLLGAELGDGRQTSVRTFQMRPEDEVAWDTLTQYWTGGYAYGSLAGADGKFARNVAIKEVHPPSAGQGVDSRAPIDPSALVNALALAQVQASIERLSGLIEDVGRDVKDILTFLHLEQEADVLAAVEAIDGAYQSYESLARTSSVDWDVIASLGQVLKKQHRQIIGELDSIGATLRFGSIPQAQRARELDPQRVANLATLEYYLLRSLARWTELLLATKARRGELVGDEAMLARRSMEKYFSTARSTLEGIACADSQIRGRRWWDQLVTHGVVMGAARDDDIKREAIQRREEIQSEISSYQLLPHDSSKPLHLTPSANFVLPTDVPAALAAT